MNYNQNNISENTQSVGETPQPQASAVAPVTDDGKKTRNKKIFVAIAVAVIIIIALITFFISSRPAPDVPVSQIDQNITTDIEPEQLTNAEIAAHILEWLETDMRDERGTYLSITNCEHRDGELICDKSNRSNRYGAVVIFANHLHYVRTGDPAALVRIENDLSVYTNPQLVEIVQTENLHCRYLLPLINDQNLSQNIRSMATEMCLNVQYESLFGGYRFLEDTSVFGQYRVQSEQIIESILAGNPNPNIFNRCLPEPLGCDDPNRFWADIANDYLAKHQVNNNPLTLDLAYFHLAGALTAYAEAPGSINHYCSLLFAGTQFCEFSNNQDDASCRLAQYVSSQITLTLEQNQEFFLEHMAKCALASPVFTDQFVAKLIEYSGSSENRHLQPFGNFRLLNERNSTTKATASNALFAGLLSLF